MDAEELRLLQASLAQVVKAAGPGELRAAVTGFGWFDLLAEDPATAVPTLAALQGEHLTDTTLLDDVVLDSVPDSAPAGAGGPVAVVHPDLADDGPTSTVSGDAVTVSGLVTTAGPGPWLVPARREGATVLLAVHELPPGTPAAIDPESGWRGVRAELPVADVDVLPGRWEPPAAAGRRALAHELTAIGDRMLALALDHVATREQFGRRLATFQSVRHALADVRVAGECARLAADAAWEDPGPDAARVAKVLAGRYVRLAAAHGQQLLGGMGFTREHAFHRYLRRALLLEPVLGSAARLRAAIGHDLRTGGLPRLADL